MRANDLFTVEDYLKTFRPSKESIESSISLLLHHAEQLLELAAAFIQDGGQYAEHREVENDMLDTAIQKTQRAIESILIAEGILECSIMAHETAQSKMHKTLLNLKEKIRKLGVEETYEPEEIHFAVSRTKHFGIEDFDQHPVVYNSDD